MPIKTVLIIFAALIALYMIIKHPPWSPPMLSGLAFIALALSHFVE